MRRPDLIPALRPPRRPRPACSIRPAGRELLGCQIYERERLARLLAKLPQALEMPWHRRSYPVLPVSDRVGATEPNEFREAPLAEPHASTDSPQGLTEGRHGLSRRLLAEQDVGPRTVLELGHLLTEFPVPHGRRRHPEVLGHLPLQESEIKPPLPESVANRAQFLRITRILRFSGPQGQVAKWQRDPGR